MISPLNRIASTGKLADLLQIPAVRQLIRYAFVGLCVTQFAALIYSALVVFAAIQPLKANLLSTICGLAVGYVAHSRWSFSAGSGDGETMQVARFLLASFIAFLVNTAWVWLLVSVLRLSPLAPVPLMMLATPWISFLLNRYWVFKVAGRG